MQKLKCWHCRRFTVSSKIKDTEHPKITSHFNYMEGQKDTEHPKITSQLSKCWMWSNWNVDIALNAGAEMLTSSFMQKLKCWTGHPKINIFFFKMLTLRCPARLSLTFYLVKNDKMNWPSENNISFQSCRSWNVDTALPREAKFGSFYLSKWPQMNWPSENQHFLFQNVDTALPREAKFGSFYLSKWPQMNWPSENQHFLFKMILTKIVICLNLAKH